MKTLFHTPDEYAKAFLEMAATIPAVGKIRPERFMQVMTYNCGSVDLFSPFPPAGDGLDRKNPLIVALGDSVTAGHFEFSYTPDEDPEVFLEKLKNGEPFPDDLYEIVDVLESYPDHFRRKLIEKYELTSVSVVNSGIAGDTILGMERRLDRDVLRYQPDLVVINAALNWRADCGSNEDYRKSYQAVVRRIKNETHADIILLTPNAALPMPLDHPESTLDERVEIIRQIAEEEQVCLADAYKVWKEYEKAGYPVKALLSNGSVHPSAAGQEGSAVVLMQLFQ